VDPHRDRLKTLSARLLRLHRLLMDREREAYERQHGAVTSADLLRLLLGDERFAWLRPLSAMIARMDELVDTDGPIAEDDARGVLAEAHRLLKSGEDGTFQNKYRDALQESPAVVMAHADVSAALPRPPASGNGEDRPG
jgi:hypothetical protein